MAKDSSNQGGPTHSPKDEPTEQRDFRKATSADEMSDRATHGDKAGAGRRNGTTKQKGR